MKSDFKLERTSGPDFPVSPPDRAWWMSVVPDRKTFYNSPDILRCYELARDRGVLVVDPEPLGVVIQRFVHAPRYRLWALHGSATQLYQLALRLRATSGRPVLIRNIDKETGQALQELCPEGSLRVSEEVIVDLARVLHEPRAVFSSRGLTYLRWARREIVYAQVSPGDPRVDQVIDIWKMFLGPRHFRLSITRDYVANRWPYGWHFLGTRDGSPVCTQIVFPHPRQDNLAVQGVEKSLNYREMPGGHPGMSDANLFFLAEHLVPRGIRYLNLGTYDGGNPGLGKRKKRFAHDVVLSYEFSVPVHHQQ